MNVPKLKTLDHKAPMTHDEYVSCVTNWWSNVHTDQVYSLTDSVREAISGGVHPKMITKGSSGSYFVRAKVDGRLQVVGQVQMVVNAY